MIKKKPLFQQSCLPFSFSMAKNLFHPKAEVYNWNFFKAFLYAFQFILRKKNQSPAMVLCLVPYCQKGKTR